MSSSFRICARLWLTFKEIAAFIARVGAHPDEPMSALLEASLAQVVAWIETQIAALQTLRHRILEFQTAGTSTAAPSEASATSAPVGEQSLLWLSLDSPTAGRVYTLGASLSDHVRSACTGECFFGKRA